MGEPEPERSSELLALHCFLFLFINEQLIDIEKREKYKELIRNFNKQSLRVWIVHGIRSS